MNFKNFKIYYAVPKTKDQKKLYWYCMFLGFAGIHRLLMGYKYWWLQLITLGGLGIWTFIDLIRIAFGSMKLGDGSALTKNF